MDSLCRPSLLIVTLLFSACGSSPSPADDAPPSCSGPCAANQICASEGACVCDEDFLDCDGLPENGCEAQGEACPGCDPLSDLVLCTERGAACGSMTVSDGCGVTRDVDCGRCANGLQCDEAHQCSAPPLGSREVCEREGESLGPCAPSLDCVRVGGADLSVCIQTCGAAKDCPEGQSCGFVNEDTARGVCLESRQAGDPCDRWWEGPGHCADPSGEHTLLCLGGSCRIPCDYLDEDGEPMTCPRGQICDGDPTEYPEYPGQPLTTCIDRPSRDPCRELPSGGRCSSYQSYERCAEDGSAVVEFPCAPSERCENGPEGAACAPLPATCVPEHSYCESETSLMHCVADRTWRRFPCETECRSSPEGASCAAAGAPTSVIQGTLLYERIDPNGSLTDWATSPSRQPAAGLLAKSF